MKPLYRAKVIDKVPNMEVPNMEHLYGRVGTDVSANQWTATIVMNNGSPAVDLPHRALRWLGHGTPRRDSGATEVPRVGRKFPVRDHRGLLKAGV